MKRSLNLMSARSRKRQQQRDCLRIWSRVCVVVLLVMAVVGSAHWQWCRQQQQRQAAAEAEYEPIRQLKIESTRLTKQIESLTSTERIPLALADHRPLLSLIGLTTQTVATHDGAVYLRQIDIERQPVSLEPNRQPELMVALVGTANEGRAATQLADHLREVGPFAEVELTSNRNTHHDEQTQQDFSIQCKH